MGEQEMGEQAKKQANDLPLCVALIRQPINGAKVWQIVRSLVPFMQAKPEDWKPLDFFIWKDGKTYWNDKTTQTNALIKSGESVIYWQREKKSSRFQTKNGTYAVWEMREGTDLSWQTVLPVSLLSREIHQITVPKAVPYVSADEVNDKIVYYEGAVQQVIVNAYERNPQARQQCIAHYGTECIVCGFDFGEVYGEIGQDFIHVHHLRPLTDIGERYEVNPVTDLRPVCPNCHAVIHRRKPPYSIEDVQKMVQGHSMLTPHKAL